MVVLHYKETIFVSFIIILSIELDCISNESDGIESGRIDSDSGIQTSEENQCPYDIYSTTLDDGKIVWINWKNTREISQPLCLNSEYKVTHRKCKDNGEWSERKECNYISKLCPGNLHYEDLDYCYATTAVTTGYENACSIPGNLYDPFDDVFKNYINPRTKYWIPHIAVEKHDLHVHYTLNMKEIHSETARQFSKCPVIYSDQISYEDCSFSNHNFCIYKPQDFLYHCPKKCVSAGLNSTECYCKCEKYNGRNPLPMFYHQLMMLKKLKDDSKSDEICAIDVSNNPPPKLTLKFKNRKHRLYLIVTSFESLYPINGQLAQCFKDGEKLEIVKMKHLEKVSKHLDLEEKRLKRITMVYSLEINEMPAEYFCIARKTPDLAIIQTNYVVAHKKFKGYIYTMQINMPDDLRIVLANYFSRKSLKLNLMRLYKNENNSNTYIYHVLDTYTNYPRDYYYYFAKGFPQQYRSAKLIYFRCIDKCLSESTALLNSTLRWPTTNIGNNAYSSDVCLQENGLPLIRRCIGNFLHGAYWDYISGSCSWTQRKSEITKELEEFAFNNDTFDNIIENVTNISKERLKAYDIYLLANIVGKHLLNKTSKPLLEIVSNLMKINRTELHRSQIVFKSTDFILNYIDTYLTDNNQQFPDVNENYYYLEKRENFILQISYPFVSNITGLAAYGIKTDTFDRFNVTALNRNMTEEDFFQDNLQIATYIPDELLEDITENMVIEEKIKLQIVVIIFFNDSLFNSNNTTQRIDGSVVSILIPQLNDDYFSYSIPLYFNATSNSSCVFWDYNVETETNSTWSDLGNDYMDFVNNSNILHCDFMHLTHFGLLITTQPLTHALQDEYVYDIIEHDYVLDVITYVGGGLSLLGVIIIFLTTILFEKFRSKTGTKILLQISLAIICEILILQIAGKIQGDTTCTIIGFLLHYVVLSKFSWMLISAYLQYNRFVKVFGPPPERILLKSFIFGWIVPLIPSLIVLLITSDGYEASQHNFCYPKDLNLYLAVFLPITIIVIANLIIFCLIMINVISPKTPQGTQQRNEQKYQIYLGILLFFLLGIPWIFGILAEIIATPIIHLIFMYLFCILATLQGFVIFVFYILLDKDTRSLFIRKFGIRDSSMNPIYSSKSTSHLDHSKSSN